MLRRCRGSGSEERSASGGEPLPAGPLRAVRGYARAYRPGHRSRGAGHYVRRSGELLPLGRVAGRRNGRGADGRPGRPVSGLSSGMPHRGASSGAGYVPSLRSGTDRYDACGGRLSVSVPCSTGTSLAKPSMFSVPFPGSSLSTNLRPTCAAAWCRSRI